ncbi:MAG: alpha-amylase, partial [Deltaproteobacteria bacterium]|nr:alpha-amylase [Deltaproteobacteria bacterium]
MMWRLLKPFRESLRTGLSKLYGEEQIDRLLERLSLIAGRYNYLAENCSREAPCWNEKSCLLTTYGDMVATDGEAPLITLRRFLSDYLAESISGIHILPFFPYSSDDGFSIIDYRKVDRQFGTWEHVSRLGDDFHLMVDLVLNHVSIHSHWFQDYIGGIAPARNYFIEMGPKEDLSAVIRPRTTPLLTPVNTTCGNRLVWTTFSSDQVDLNYS